MSTKIFESETLDIVQYACPIKSKCLQISKTTSSIYFIPLNYKEVKELIPELQKWIDNYDK